MVHDINPSNRNVTAIEAIVSAEEARIDALTSSAEDLVGRSALPHLGRRYFAAHRDFGIGNDLGVLKAYAASNAWKKAAAATAAAPWGRAKWGDGLPWGEGCPWGGQGGSRCRLQLAQMLSELFVKTPAGESGTAECVRERA